MTALTYYLHVGSSAYANSLLLMCYSKHAMIRYWYQVLPSGKPNSKRLSAYVSVKVCSKKLVINDPKLKKINKYVWSKTRFLGFSG